MMRNNDSARRDFGIGGTVSSAREGGAIEAIGFAVDLLEIQPGRIMQGGGADRAEGN